MKTANSSMTVGMLAKQAGVKIRYYELRGLLPKPPRTNSGYRTFTHDSVERLSFIKQVQALGFTLTEEKQVLTLRLSPGMTCTDVREQAQAKMADIKRKINSLNAMTRALQQLVSASAVDGPASECSFLANLDQRRLQ